MTDAGSFWAWSVEIYARPGVAEACLALQDQRGVDVNLLLLGLWLAARGQALPSQTAADLADHAESWQRVVVGPLRGVRRSLKTRETDPAVAELRREVAAVELAAERLLQTELERRVRGRTSDAPATADTAALCWQRLIAHRSLDRQWTAPLLRAAFGRCGAAADPSSRGGSPRPSEPD